MITSDNYCSSKLHPLVYPVYVQNIRMLLFGNIFASDTHKQPLIGQYHLSQSYVILDKLQSPEHKYMFSQAFRAT